MLSSVVLSCLFRRPCDNEEDTTETSESQETGTSGHKTANKDRYRAPSALEKKSSPDVNGDAYRAVSRLDKPKAWEVRNETSSILTNSLTEYSYEDIAFIIDRISFVTFFIFTIFLSLVFFVLIEIGGRSEV